MTLPLLATSTCSPTPSPPSSSTIALVELMGGGIQNNNINNGYRRARRSEPLSNHQNKKHPQVGRKKFQKADVRNDSNSCHENLIVEFWESLPSSIRFGMSAGIGNLIFYFLDQYLYHNVFIEQDTLSFFVAYLMQVYLQHLLNAVLVYGVQTIDTWEKYRSTLTTTYSAYFGTLIASTCFNTLLLQYGGVPKNIAFWSTLAIFGIVNYLLLSKYVGKENTTTTTDYDVNEKRRQIFFFRRVKNLLTLLPTKSVSSFLLSIFIRETSSTSTNSNNNVVKRGHV